MFACVYLCLSSVMKTEINLVNIRDNLPQIYGLFNRTLPSVRARCFLSSVKLGL